MVKVLTGHPNAGSQDVQEFMFIYGANVDRLGRKWGRRFIRKKLGALIDYLGSLRIWYVLSSYAPMVADRDLQAAI
jgi:hypothetical protein